MKLQKLIILILSIFSLQFAYAQNQNLRGRVVDESNNGIAGVTVVNAATNRAITATDDNGNFGVSVAPNTALIFKAVGFNQRRITVRANQTTLTVQMSSTQDQVEEVVVRGYVARKKENTTGSSFTLGEKDIRDVPTANLEQLMQGKVPGLNVQVNTGAPGFRGSTQIRGLSTLSTTGSGSESILMPTSPLYVIDGVPMDADRASEFGLQQQGPGISPLSLIPPEDVQSIEILKDAQATSLYGSQGAYGVIIITTKRGNSPVPRINYTHSTFLKTPPKLRETLGGNLERQIKIWQIINNARTQAEIDRIMQTPMLADSLNAFFNNSTNWQSLYYQNTFNQNHNLSLDGGNEILSYKSNLGYYGETGVIKNTGFNRYSANLRMDYRPTKRFEFTGQVFAQLGKQNKGDGTGILQTGVSTGGMNSTLLPPPGFFSADNDYIAAIRTKNDNSSKLIRPYVEGKFEILPGLRLQSAMSYEFASNNEDKFTPAAAAGQFSEVYSFAGRESNLYNRNILNYTKDINEDHNIFINLFNEVRHNQRQNTITKQARTPNDQFEGPLGFDGYFSRGGGVLSNFRNEKALSFALATTYSYKSKYILDLSYRLDGSSANGFKNLYTKNPAVGVRWNAHHEEWIKSLPWINLASLRFTWGVNVMPTSTLERIYGKYDISGLYNQINGIGINYEFIPNPNLLPVTSMQYNLGVDLTFLNNKIEIIYDTYYKKVDNLLFESFLNNTSGFDKLNSNDAGLANYGHEIALNFRPLSVNSPFNWTLSFNGAYNQDILLQLPSTFRGQAIKWDTQSDKLHMVNRVGTSALSNYLLENIGVYATDADVPVDPATGLRYRTADGTFFQAGDPIYVDRNGDYILDNRDYARAGNTQPLWTGGMQNTLNYKNFQLSVYASYTAKRTILNYALAQRLSLYNNPYGGNLVGGQSNGANSIVPIENLDIWLKDGDIAKYPYPYDFSRNASVQPFRYDQTLWEENGSYFKINNIIFAYVFDRDLLRRFKLDRFRIYASMDNVYTFSSYSGPNPENVTSLGRDASNGYPVPRTYTLGFNLSF
ncbi:SusC/RagA family TonB-linked outer membrane protein [Sphingobacterium mizutaii]|uniref:SusC/RagA family TonB-linked outer membrane protein n=1 Tax=Sphingobacterium mizutaii TaxID=1010 RepID=UPI0016277465|nr:SusC/RagA family TonB-linked outer membrane protein [Sphingobacterium mizutaii]